MTLLTKAKLKELEAELDSDDLSCANWCFTRGRDLIETLEKALAVVDAAKEVAKSYKAITVIGSPIFHLKEALAPFLEERK